MTVGSIEEAVTAICADLVARGYSALQAEQLAAMNDRACPAQAIGMLDDLRDRVGVISEATYRMAVEAVLEHTRLSPEQRAFAEARLLLIVNAVGTHVVAGAPFYPGGEAPPATLADFTELHDYCDANELGGLCDDAITEEGNRLFPYRVDGETLATQEWMQMSNCIQALADEWIVQARRCFRLPTWQPLTMLVEPQRRLPDGAVLDVEIPLGWWDVTGPNDSAASFACGYYLLWVESKQASLSGDTPRFILEILGEDGEQLRVILATDDWVDMQACLATLPSSRDYLAAERRSR